jgi:WD40 repeat protein
MCGTGEGVAVLWNWRQGKEVQRFVGHEGAVRAVTLSPDGKTLATGSNGYVRLWEPQSGQEMLKLEVMKTDIQHLKFSTYAKRLACWCRQEELSGPSEIFVWSIER